MAPDRGETSSGSSSSSSSSSSTAHPNYKSIPQNENSSTSLDRHPSVDVDKSGGNPSSSSSPPSQPGASDPDPDPAAFINARAAEGQNFTVRGVVVGLFIGIIICFSNTYFGLQTGWVSGMAMPAALMSFAFFKSIARHIELPFTPVENVLVQTVAGAVGTMPLGCGFVGVLPALNFLLEDDENGPLNLGLGKLIIWAVGICFFGVFIAVPLRREVLIREKLKFPSGTATALMIGVLHGDEKFVKVERKEEGGEEEVDEAEEEENDDGMSTRKMVDDMETTQAREDQEAQDRDDKEALEKSEWKAKIQMLIVCFGISAGYTIVSYFIPQAHDIPIFGLPLASVWQWTLNPSPAYVGQGIIMGPATTSHMLLGAILGWGILSPIANHQGWAPGPVSDWTTGSKGWIVWVSLAIMLADSLVSLGWLVLRPLIKNGPQYYQHARESLQRNNFSSLFHLPSFSKGDYLPLDTGLITDPSNGSTKISSSSDEDEPDAPPEHLIPTKIATIGFILSIALCALGTHFAFSGTVPIYANLLSILFALLLSIMGVRALGETDLNPVSGISKLTQLLFAAFIPSSSKNSVIINLVAGAISESGALQAGDMMQDLKTGHLLGAAPRAQFYGQIIGSFVGAIVSACVYKLYTHVYTIPGGMFDVPTAYVWIFTARLVTGKGLPPMAWQFALGAGLLWAFLTALRIWMKSGTKIVSEKWVAFVPGGIAVAVGMYNTPSFTLARFVGGMVSGYWVHYKGREEVGVVVLASGLILGEGVASIVNLAMAAGGVPHLEMDYGGE
ncbi:hypothetical protein MMC25_007413 [Agyrium rufum]|nr:hypothetical protein [Agyrium rufum]